MVVREFLQGINAYPIPQETIEGVALRRGLDLSLECTSEVVESKEMNLAKADLLEWLSEAPNISQGGQTYSIPVTVAKQMLERAKVIRAEYGEGRDNKKTNTVKYGYKGSRL